MLQTEETTAKKSSLGITLTIVAVFLGLAILVWEEVLEDRLIPKRWGVVEEGSVYRSGQLSRHLLERTLLKNKIDTVIDLNGIEKNNTIALDQSAEMEICQEHGIEHVRLPLAGDGTGDIEQYARAIKKIMACREEGKRVLVHCAAGSQRTGGVVASYRMLIEKKSPKAAYAELLKYDWNPRKDQILLDYVNANIEHLALRLTEAGVLKEMPKSLPTLATP